MTAPTRAADLTGLDDATLPAVPALLTEPAAVLAPLLADAAGDLRSVTPRQVSWTPGRRLVVRYDATVRWPEGETTEMLVATTGAVPDGCARVEAGEVSVGVWRVPDDPWLPGLAPISAPGEMHRLLDTLGLPAGELASRLVAYRPGRRAVLRVQRAGTTLYVKVVRPDEAEALHERHRLLHPAAPVPQSLGYDPALGLVVLQALDGELLRTALRGNGPLPDGPTLLAVLDRLPAPAAGMSASGWGADRFRPLLAALRPRWAGELADLTAEIAQAERALPDPLVAVHGDFHEAQLLVAGGDVVGLLDVDTFGAGRRVDDLATMVGHLAALALGAPHRQAVERYALRLLGHFDRQVDPVALRYGVAAVLLGLATGPFRVCETAWRHRTDERIELAKRWAESARRVAGT